MVDRHLRTGAIPVLVEGPTDAIAVTVATGGIYLGVASLGTAFTDEHATQLAQLARVAGRQPIVATDADLAGRIAAERSFWMLTPHGLDPRFAQLPPGSDPAELLCVHGRAALTAALTTDRRLGQLLLDERLTNLPADQARADAIGVLAALPPSHWDAGARQISEQLGVDLQPIRHQLRAAVTRWDTDPRTAAQSPLGNTTAVRDRLAAAAALSPQERWAASAAQLDDRLLKQGDWAALAARMQAAHEDGHDITALARQLIDQTPLNNQPTQDLRHRLAASLEVTTAADASPVPAASPTRSLSAPQAAPINGAAKQRRHPPTTAPPRPDGRHR